MLIAAGKPSRMVRRQHGLLTLIEPHIFVEVTAGSLPRLYHNPLEHNVTPRFVRHHLQQLWPAAVDLFSSDEAIVHLLLL